MTALVSPQGDTHQWFCRPCSLDVRVVARHRPIGPPKVTVESPPYGQSGFESPQAAEKAARWHNTHFHGGQK